jgi:hypothetical protein
VDIVAKYVERLTQWTAQHPGGYPVIEI